MEIWKKWVPIEEISSSFCIDTILNDTEGIFVTLKHNEKYIVVTIIGAWFSYRMTQKDTYLKKRYGKEFCDEWSLFTVENSEYLAWLKEESYGVYENEREEYKTKHYVFMGSNIVFEILSPGGFEFAMKNE